MSEIVKPRSSRPTVAIACQIGVLTALVACALPAARSSAAVVQRQAIHPQTLLTIRHPISDLFVAGTRAAFFEPIDAMRNRWDVGVWSRQTKVLRRFRWGDACEGWLALAGRDVYWECDEPSSTISHSTIWVGVVGRRPMRLARAVDSFMSLASDGQLAVFLRKRFLWRLEGKQPRVLARGPNADGEILDVEAEGILIQRNRDGRLVLLRRDGKVLHVFTDRFECCSIQRGYALAGSKLVTITDDAVEVYDRKTEAPVRSFPIEDNTDMALVDVRAGLAVYAPYLRGETIHVLSMSTGRKTVITRRNALDLGKAAGLGRDGLYYAETIRGRGRLQFVPYKQLRP